MLFPRLMSTFSFFNAIQVTNLMKTELGPEHPQTLKTYENLVFILKSQKGLTEAMDTAKSLKLRSKRALEERHPQALSSSLALAEVQLETGNYLDAVSELRQLTVMSQQTYGAHHIHTLQYRATYARALFQIGLSEEAKLEALSIIQGQQRYFWFSSSKDYASPQSPSIAWPDANAVKGLDAGAQIRRFVDENTPDTHDCVPYLTNSSNL
jgi:tetratricopeptide (TPR) repeat protein